MEALLGDSIAAARPQRQPEGSSTTTITHPQSSVQLVHGPRPGRGQLIPPMGSQDRKPWGIGEQEPREREKQTREGTVGKAGRNLEKERREGEQEHWEGVGK